MTSHHNQGEGLGRWAAEGRPTGLGRLEGDRPEPTSGAEGTESGADQKTMEGTEKVRISGYPYQGPSSRDATRGDRGRFVATDETGRFWTKVNRANHEDCWVWTGTVDADGYGLFRTRRAGRWVYVRAHRWAWEHINRVPVPASRTLDHRCHTDHPTCPGGRACPHRACVNPAHLDVVTRGENLRRAHARRRNQPNREEETTQ